MADINQRGTRFALLSLTFKCFKDTLHFICSVQEQIPPNCISHETLPLYVTYLLVSKFLTFGQGQWTFAKIGRTRNQLVSESGIKNATQF